jgi:hypothetical protein
MTITRIVHVLGATAITGVLAFTAYAGHAGATVPPAAHGTQALGNVAPAPHAYGANGMRMGLHCESSDMSLP